MERELGGLGHCSDQHQRPADRGVWPSLDQRSDLGRSRFRREDYQAREQSEATGTGDERSLSSSNPGGRSLAMVSNQQIGTESRRLPEHEEREDVLTQDQTQHRDCECGQDPYESATTSLPAEVGR